LVPSGYASERSCKNRILANLFGLIDFRLWSLRASTALRFDISRQQCHYFNDLQRLRSLNSATAFDNRRRIGLKAKYLARVRAFLETIPEMERVRFPRAAS
jgi:hypothetical protein